MHYLLRYMYSPTVCMIKRISDRIMTMKLVSGNFEREHGGHGYGQQNPEGENILSFAQAYNLVVASKYILSKERRAPNNIQR